MKILNTKQVAEILGVKPAEVYQLTKESNLPYMKVGKNYRFFEESILKWKAAYDKWQKDNAVMDAKEVSAILGFSVAKVYTLAKTNAIPCTVSKYGDNNRYLFREKDFFEWLMSIEQNKPAEEPEAGTKQALGCNGLEVAA